MNNNIIEKIRKLLAHEKSARSIGNIKEAEAFAARIQEILDAHKLSMDEVAFQEREQGEPIGWEHVGHDDEDFHYSKKRAYWQLQLAGAIAEANECRVVRQHDGNSLFFVGRTSNRELCKMIFIYLLDLAFELAQKSAVQEKEIQRIAYFVACDKVLFEEPTDVGFRGWMKEFKKAWLKGFTSSVCARFYAQAAATKTQMSETALVFIGRDIVLIKKEVDDKTQNAPVYNRGKVRNTGAFKLGEATGKAVNLTPHMFEGAKGRTSRLLGV